MMAVLYFSRHIDIRWVVRSRVLLTEILGLTNYAPDGFPTSHDDVLPLVTSIDATLLEHKLFFTITLQ